MGSDDEEDRCDARLHGAGARRGDCADTAVGTYRTHCPEQVQYGNLCGPTAMDPCYKPALKGGFPVAYLFDAPGISVERQLAFFEDNLHAGALLADVAVYFTMLMTAAWVVSRRRQTIAQRVLTDHAR